MNKNNSNTIEIKGQLYDSTKGVPIQAIPSVPSSIPVTHVSSSTRPQPVGSTGPQHSVKNAQRHAPKTSPVLMRSAVKKPALSFKRRLKISESTDSILDQAPVTEVPLEGSPAAQHVERSRRAALIQQSERISHFVPPSENPAVEPAKPNAEASQPPHVTASARPKSPTDLLLERGLNRATAHQERSREPAKPKWPRVSLVAVPVAVVLALLVIGGYGFTNLQLRVASAKAGFNTSLPTYRPAGYALGQLSYNSGIFASEFLAKNGNQSYTITQKSTVWNAQDLLNNYVIVTDPNYRVVQLGTRTIYVYGSGDATWVSGNIWYQINSDGSLNEAQIIDMANSL